jgi:sulfate transport system permease protein
LRSSVSRTGAAAGLVDEATPALVAPVTGAHGQLPGGRRRRTGQAVNGRGQTVALSLVVTYLSLIVLIPLAAVVWAGQGNGFDGFVRAITTPEAASTLRLTIGASLVVALVNMLMGTLIAWLLVRDLLPGRSLLDALIDLPFALPTIVAGLALLTVYGPGSPIGIDIAYSRLAVVVALLFVTLPFVVRTVQPVLHELDTEMEEAAASLGARPGTIFYRIILPNIMPAMAAGTALAFARAVSEFGATVLISGNLPFKTQVASVHIFNQLESDNITGAAAVSTVLLLVSLAMLVSLDLLQRWAARRG